MRTAYLALLLLASLGCAAPGGARFEVVTLPTDAVFRDVIFLDAERGFLVGGGFDVEGGIVGRTTDGGLTWSFRSGLTRPSGRTTSFELRAGWFHDANRGIVVGDGGTILRTMDGGETWHRVHFGPRISSHLFDVHFIDDRRGWAVGHAGVLATDDGGATWFRPLAATDEEREAIENDPERSPATDADGWALQFLDARRGVVVGRNGTIRITEDGGVSWRRARPSPAPALHHLTAVHFVDDVRGFAVGEGGVILATADGGATWWAVDVATDAYLTDVHFPTPERGFAVGYRRADGTSTVFESNDGGATWAPHVTVFGEELHAITFVDPGHGWAVGDRSRREPQKLLRYDATTAGDGG